MSKSIRETIDDLFSLHPQVSSGDVAAAAGVSRQAAHYHFKKMEKSGLVRHEGAGRTAHYVRNTLRSAEYSLQGLSDSDVWTLEHRALKDLDLVILDNPAVVANLNFTFTALPALWAISAISETIAITAIIAVAATTTIVTVITTTTIIAAIALIEVASLRLRALASCI